jgi:Ferritin-like domain
MGDARCHLARCALAALAVAALLAGCGGGDGDGQVAREKAADAEILNVAIGQELTLAEAFESALPHLRRAEAGALFRRMIAQEREHLDGFTKAMRGLGGEVEVEAEEVDVSSLKGEREFLLLTYELTGLQLTRFLDDVTDLQMPAPQSFAASTAASQAQHLVALRRLLGAGLVESVPEAFDTGEVPPPGPPPPAPAG